ncbi:MAG TPA: sigma-70 family RNA polymerase sigma factor [Gaiellaceae bacterium]|nr:sigma-70 family RNA polymerase sigma factor [Gaiellaceae bacterium]
MELAVQTPARLHAVPAPPTPVTDDGEPTDAALLVRVGERDREAFEQLYRRYIRSVMGLALRRLRDRGRAEDAVQEIFAAVWRSAGSYKPERGPAAPWLYAVARNAIIDRMRTRNEPAAEVPDTPSGEPGPLERAETSYVSWRVHRALEELPEKEREVVELAYWSGMSQSEVAEYLAIPLGTVKTRTRSALSRLAGLLEGEELR